jgi:hypothetical protein
VSRGIEEQRTNQAVAAPGTENCDLDALDVCFHIPGLSEGAAERAMDRFAA